MAQTTAAKTKNRFGGDQFPIHYEGRGLRVYTNPSGEVFVENPQSGISMRISSPRPGELQFTTEGRVEPTLVTNMIGWRVSPR